LEKSKLIWILAGGEKPLDVSEFHNLLNQHSSQRFGLCMFAPAILAPVTNRRFNEAFGDGGDNLSVPMGPTASGVVRYWAGNYSSADLDHCKASVEILAKTPGAALLVTEPGIGASRGKTVLGFMEHGQFRTSGIPDQNFYTFSKNYLHVVRVENPTNEIEGMSEFGVCISAQILTPERHSQLVLRTPWEAIFEAIQSDPASIYQFSKDPRAFEEFIADTYRLDGFEVELTPRSNDGGVDVIATKAGFGAIKILDQAKAYAEHRRVTANDVRAAYGVLCMQQDASKVVVTTTSDFAPGVYREFSSFMPSRVDLRSGQGLIEWLKDVENVR
jgi:restriction system protein